MEQHNALLHVERSTCRLEHTYRSDIVNQEILLFSVAVVVVLCDRHAQEVSEPRVHAGVSLIRFLSVEIKRVGLWVPFRYINRSMLATRIQYNTLTLLAVSTPGGSNSRTRAVNLMLFPRSKYNSIELYVNK